MNILGISAFYHDSAAALVQDGDIVAAVQEERFSRIKHDDGFPSQAVAYCLSQAGITARQLDLVVFYEKPLLRFERLLETYIGYAPRGFRQFLVSMPVWLKKKLFLSRELDRALKGHYTGRFVFTEHHESHAASAFFPSPFDESAILTLDGVGEWATASLGVGKANRLELQQVLHFPHSLGLLYSAFTHYTGFRVNSGEYKLMGLAPYGEPRFSDVIRSHLLDLKEDGSFRLNMNYFSYCHSMVMINQRFEALFDAPARTPETPISQHTMDVAASIQEVTEEIMLRMTHYVHACTGQKNLVMAGGVALNCVGNGKILRQGPFERVWIQPAAGDAGGALGAALFVWYQLLNHDRVTGPDDLQKGSLLGPSFTNDAITHFLDGLDAPYHVFEQEDDLVQCVAELMADGQVIGWFHGPMEFGPRALGHRSILGDARSTTMQSVMNRKIKFRESFRPFAPCVLAEHASEYFDITPDQESPYMLVVAPVHQAKRLVCDNESARGLDRVKTARSVIPAVTHVDGSARVQTVDSSRHPRLHKLMMRFNEATKCPVVINTSFNIRGEPIVCTPQQAYRCFMATDMDVLVLENEILYKQEQPQSGVVDVGQYKSQFKLD